MAKNLKLSSKNRIATLGTYKKLLEERKEKVVNEISRLTSCMNPINYMNTRRELEKFIEINSKKSEDKDEIVIKTQEEFIKALKDTCFETEDAESLKNLIYKIRYYRYLYVTKDKQVKDIDLLDNEINEVLKQVIQKLVNLENMKKITNDNELNQKIISNILDTKVIDLSALKFEIFIKEDCISIKTYEKEVFEKQFEISGEFSKKNFEIRTEKIYKLFI